VSTLVLAGVAGIPVAAACEVCRERWARDSLTEEPDQSYDAFSREHTRRHHPEFPLPERP
jgi:hypothetical protein